MINTLMNCYYEGMTIEQTTNFIKRCYDKAPTQKQIDKAKQIINQTLNKEWQ